MSVCFMINSDGKTIGSTRKKCQKSVKEVSTTVKSLKKVCYLQKL